MGPTRTQGRPARSRRLTLDNADGGSGICAQQSGYPLQDGIWQAHRLIPRTEMLCSKVGLCGFTTPLRTPPFPHTCVRLSQAPRPDELPVLSAWEPTGYQAHTQTRLPSGYPRRHQPRGQMSGETPQPPKASNASRLPVAQARPAPRLGGAKDESWGEIPQNALPE